MQFDPKLALPESTWRLTELFGPLSGMHAALDKLDVGMPCGVVARFVNKTRTEIEAAVETARQQFPVLQRRMVWLDSQATLVPSDLSGSPQRSASALSLGCSAHDAEHWWRYRLIADGKDVWLTGIWAHAAADGPSMLRLLKAVGAVADGAAAPRFVNRANNRLPTGFSLGWLLRFVYEQQCRRYLYPREDKHPIGVAWLTIPFAHGISLCAEARKQCGGFVAWLSAAASLAFREQQESPAGRLLLDLPDAREISENLGGFGFGTTSLIMSVKVSTNDSLPALARKIAARRRKMVTQGWAENFERFLGSKSGRHIRFAKLCARGQSAPMITVSWKGQDWCLGGNNDIRDVACFAKSTAVHVSSHLDQNGLSLSVTSTQSADARKDLLHRIVTALGANATREILTFDGRSIDKSNPCSGSQRIL
jgi:hypothetical protein